MKRNSLVRTLSLILVVGMCFTSLITPVFALDESNQGWINCDTSTADIGNRCHPWGYAFSDGTQAHDNWYYIDGYWYYFKNYTIAYGEQEINGKWYFLDYNSGHLLTNQYASVGSHAQIWADENGVLQ